MIHHTLTSLRRLQGMTTAEILHRIREKVRCETDRIRFSIAGLVTTDQRDVQGEPTLTTGTLGSGNGASMSKDDTSYYTTSSSASTVQFEVSSKNFVFTALDTVSVPLVVRSSKDGVTLELYVHNPTDPAHTSGGYDPTPDLATTIPVKNVDKALTLLVPAADITYLNTLSPISIKLKVRATFSSDFQLEVDQLVFITTSTAPSEVVQQITQQYLDPGLKHPNFASVAAKEGYLLRLYEVHPGLLNVNWASHTADFQAAKTNILIFRGFVVESGVVVTPGKITAKPTSQSNELLLSVTSRPNEAFVRTGFLDVDVGVYTIVFFNDSASSVITDSFAATGAKADTWVYAPVFKDYLVTAIAGKVGLQAVLRQIPGPTEPPSFPWSTTNINWIENLVLIQSWEPFGVP